MIRAKTTRKSNPTGLAEVVFLAIRRRGEKLVPKLGSVRIQRCGLADREHAAQHRQYAHYNHFSRTVCYAAALDYLDPENVVGIIAHELGHAAADILGLFGKHREGDANKLGGAMLGAVVRFSGPERLERASVPRWLEREVSWR